MLSSAVFDSETYADLCLRTVLAWIGLVGAGVVHLHLGIRKTLAAAVEPDLAVHAGAAIGVLLGIVVFGVAVHAIRRVQKFRCSKVQQQREEIEELIAKIGDMSKEDIRKLNDNFMKLLGRPHVRAQPGRPCM